MKDPKSMLDRPLLGALALAAALAASGCNTMEGAGEDIQQGGEAIEDTAEDLNDDDPNTP